MSRGMGLEARETGVVSSAIELLVGTATEANRVGDGMVGVDQKVKQSAAARRLALAAEDEPDDAEAWLSVDEEGALNVGGCDEAMFEPDVA